jgi:hypothetical protein
MDAEVEWVAEPPPKPPKPSDIEAAKAAINHAQVACASALGLPLGVNVDAGDGSPVFAALAQAYAVLCERERSQPLRMISRQKETTPSGTWIADARAWGDCSTGARAPSRSRARLTSPARRSPLRGARG